jgi:hypothetical protein
MYYLTYLGNFVTGMSKNDITTSEEYENMLQFKTRRQAEKLAKDNAWFSVIEVHSTDEQKIYIYKQSQWITVFSAEPKDKKRIRQFALDSGIWNALERPLTVTKATLGGYIATFS